MPDLVGLYTGVLLVCSGSFVPHWTCDFHSGSLTLVGSTKSRIDPCLSAPLLSSSSASYYLESSWYWCAGTRLQCAVRTHCPRWRPVVSIMLRPTVGFVPSCMLCYIMLIHAVRARANLDLPPVKRDIGVGRPNPQGSRYLRAEIGRPADLQTQVSKSRTLVCMRYGMGTTLCVEMFLKIRVLRAMTYTKKQPFPIRVTDNVKGWDRHLVMCVS